MSHRDIIEDLSDRIGTQADLADILGVHRSRLPKWKEKGIPPRHWPRILRVAKDVKYRLTLAALDDASQALRQRLGRR